MRSQPERFVAAARIRKQATIKVEFCYISILYFRHSGKKLIKRRLINLLGRTASRSVLTEPAIKDCVARLRAPHNHAIKPPFAAGNKFPSADYGLLPALLDDVIS